MTEQKVKLNYLRIAPRKVRLIANLIKGMSVNDAEAHLSSLPNRSTGPILKLLHSAVSNAKENKKDGQKMNPDHLFIKSIFVDGGPMLKRFLPRARGMATPIQKKSSHITIILGENKELKPRFNIIIKKKEKKEANPEKEKRSISKSSPEKGNEKFENKERKDKGFFKKIFRRKSV